MEEQVIWEDIQDFEGRYLVNLFGEVYSLVSNKYLKSLVYNTGYIYYTLTKEDGTQKTITGHRLVALAFVPNPNNYPIINHIDENKLNNYYKNLEWCTVGYNNNYSNNGKRAGLKTGKETYIYKVTGELVGVYYSEREAAKQCDIAFSAVPAMIQTWNNECVKNKNLFTYNSMIASDKKRTKEEIKCFLKNNFVKINNDKVTQKNNKKISKQIAQIDIETNEVIKVFPSAHEAGRELNINPSHLSRAARLYSLRKVNSHGYYWKYV